MRRAVHLLTATLLPCRCCFDLDLRGAEGAEAALREEGEDERECGEHGGDKRLILEEAGLSGLVRGSGCTCTHCPYDSEEEEEKDEEEEEGEEEGKSKGVKDA